MRRDPQKQAAKPRTNGGGKRHEHPGQPEKYRDDFPAIAEQACALGATDVELAAILQISVPTLLKYERDHELFFKAINRGKDYFDNKRIKASVRDRALGYTWTEVSEERTEIDAEKHVKTAQGDFVQVRDDRGRKVVVRVPASKTKTTSRHVPADPACAFFWLTNRHRGEWQHVRVNRVEGKLDGPQPITNIYQLTADDINDIPQGDLENLADTLTKAAERKRLAEERRRAGGDKGTPSGTA